MLREDKIERERVMEIPLCQSSDKRVSRSLHDSSINLARGWQSIRFKFIPGDVKRIYTDYAAQSAQASHNGDSLA